MIRQLLFGAAVLMPTMTLAVPRAQDIRWVRESGEYAALVQQTYLHATLAVEQQAQTIRVKHPWSVVMDLDETVLDNSPYQLELLAYEANYTPESWGAWVMRAQAELVPGARGFIEAVRGAGGKMVYLSNRGVEHYEATKRNLERQGLWQKGDVLCLKRDENDDDKARRRTEVREGKGDCTATRKPSTVLAYVGDQLSDFPSSEETGVNRLEGLGRQYFLLPNPMYGSWMRRSTREEGLMKGGKED